MIDRRVDAGKPNVGLTTWAGASAGSRVKRSDAGVAKNYLNHEELETLNLVVSAYLDFAKLQALNRKPMAMRDWIAKLDDFLRVSDRELLSHAGSVSLEAAMARASTEYERCRAMDDAKPEPVDVHFEAVIEKTKKLGSAAPKKQRGGAE